MIILEFLIVNDFRLIIIYLMVTISSPGHYFTMVKVLSLVNYLIPRSLFYSLITILSTGHYFILWSLFCPQENILSPDQYFIPWSLLYPQVTVLSPVHQLFSSDNRSQFVIPGPLQNPGRSRLVSNVLYAVGGEELNGARLRSVRIFLSSSNCT